MKLIEFPEQKVVIAKDQPEYMPMPAWGQPNDPKGQIVCCWKLTLRERLKLLWTGRIWHSMLTFHKPIQPQLLTIDKPDMPTGCGETGNRRQSQ